MKYYFITYQGTNRDGSISIWNEVIDESPMSYILRVRNTEEKGSRTYHELVITNALEITEEEFEKYRWEF